jgi:diguanylate cyclase (GGDEF)-like protein
VIQEDRPLRLSTSEGPQTCHWLGVPLPAQDGAMGALLLQGPAEGDTYSEADKELLQFVSTQVALAIERTQMHERLQHMAQYDQLTGLPNRALFNDRLRIAMARAHREQTPLSLLFIDLDRFKEVNDTLGHAMGDLLLQGVAQRLQACVRGSDTVARLGGDEFVVLLEGVHAGELPQPVAQKILTAFAQPFDLKGRALGIRPSIGMAVFPEHGTHESMLLSHADEAMYQAKRNGGNQFIVHPRSAATHQGLSGSANNRFG